MQHQIVVAACNADSNVVAWDLATGTQIAQYKGNHSGRNRFCRLGLDYLVAAQSSRDALHFWTWHKDAALQRSFTQERLTALAASTDGSLVAGGGASGTLYLWAAASGALLRAWPGHLKAASALAFVDGAGVLLSGGEDTLVHAWLLAEAADASAAEQPGARLEAMHTWSEHTLPITALAVGAGGTHAVIATASLDRTVKLWHLATGRLLRSCALPAAVTALSLSASEHALYAGCLDGVVHELALYGSGGAAAAASGEGASRSLEGHLAAVNSLCLSLDGDLLLSGSDDGTVRVWDLGSHQCVRALATPSKAPVSCALVAEWPQHLPPLHTTAAAAAAAAAGPGPGSAAQAAAAVAGSVARPPKRLLPLAPFSKFAGTGCSLQAWEDTPVILDGSCPPQSIAAASTLLGGDAWRGGDASTATLLAQLPVGRGGECGSSTAMPGGGGGEAGALTAQDGSAGAAEAGGAGAPALAALQQKLLQAQAACRQWQQLHSELFQWSSQQLVLGAAQAPE